jgi:hypothetical protein
MTMANTVRSKDLLLPVPRIQGLLPQVPTDMSGRPRLSTVGVRRPCSMLSTPYESESLALANQANQASDPSTTSMVGAVPSFF